MADLAALKEAILKGKRNDVPALVQQALAAGVEPNAIINDFMIPAMNEVGRASRPKKSLCLK
jgi:5-methyltetrahydrofolate--homocysteine methyltransferase